MTRKVNHGMNTKKFKKPATRPLPLGPKIDIADKNGTTQSSPNSPVAQATQRIMQPPAPTVGESPIPRLHNGGLVKEDGLYRLKKGERVIPAEPSTDTPTSYSISPDGIVKRSGKVRFDF